MEAKIGRFFDSVGAFFTGAGDQIPWCSRDIIAGCEREVAEAANGVSDELKNESIMRLSWALVHSRQAEDVQRGLDMLEASLANTSSPLQKREKLYLLAVGYYRRGEYPRSRQLVGQCLEEAIVLQNKTYIVESNKCADQPANNAHSNGLVLMILEDPQEALELCSHSDFCGAIYVCEVVVWLCPPFKQTVADKIAPDWRQALTLKKTVEDRIAKDGVVGIGITATVVGLIAGGIAAALARRN